MPYEGEVATWCPGSGYDFSNTWAVTVSGSSWNPCGHMILNVGGCGGTYFHVTGRPAGVDGHRYPGLSWYPMQMRGTTFYRYLTENKKVEWKRWRIPLTNPAGALKRLEDLLTNRWLWKVLPHNCVAFVESVVEAGGVKKEILLTNCPALMGRDRHGSELVR